MSDENCWVQLGKNLILGLVSMLTLMVFGCLAVEAGLFWVGKVLNIHVD